MLRKRHELCSCAVIRRFLNKMETSRWRFLLRKRHELRSCVREVSTLERNYEILAKEWASHKTPFCNIFFALLSFLKESSKIQIK